MPRILIVGGGYAGFYTALKLEKWLRKGEAEVVLVDPLPYMTYQPFLPEVAAGSLEPRHAVVSHRRHLRSTRVITAKVSGVNHASKTATIEPEVGETFELDYDYVVMTAPRFCRPGPTAIDCSPSSSSAAASPASRPLPSCAASRAPCCAITRS